MTEASTPRFPWGRSIAGILSASAFAIAVLFAWECWQLRGMCVNAQGTVLAVFENAFGAIGTFQSDFNPKYDFTCKEMLVVENGIGCRSYDDIGVMLAGLRASFVIHDMMGNIVLEDNLTDQSFRPTWANPDTGTFSPIFPFSPVKPGNYRIRLTVHEPAASLVNTSHQVAARYELCGVELLQTLVLGALSFLAFLTSMALIIGIVFITKRKRRRNKQVLDHEVA